MHRWTCLAVVVLSVGAAGCTKKPQPDPQLDTYLAGAKGKLAKVAGLKAAVAAAPRLTADTLALPAKGTFTVISADQLKGNLGDCFDGAMVCGDAWWLLSRCKDVAAKSKEAIVDQWDGTTKLKECAAIRYLAVARKTAFSPPSLADKKYAGGDLAADVFVYEIDTGKSLGGFRAKGTTPEGFRAREGTAERVLKEELMGFIGTDLFSSIQKRIGGS